jgi:membrane-associated phospholipid phosphatase
MNFLQNIMEHIPILILMYFLYMYMIFQNKLSLILFVLSILTSFINVYVKFKLMNWMKEKNHSLPILGNFCRPIDINCDKIDTNKFYTAIHYGMPSGHTQLLFFILTFYYFYTKDNNTISYSIFYPLFLLSIFVAISRYTTRMHSPQQIILGGIFGSLLGYSFSFLIRYIPQL